MQNVKKDKETVRAMFDSIAWKYDFLNHFLSLGIDKRWRKKVTKIVLEDKHSKILDVATGTGDLAIAIAKKARQSEIVAVDMSKEMLKIAETKISERGFSNITVMEQDALDMVFEDGFFDVVTISFGVRNFEDLNKGLSELSRVVKSGGRVIVMEVSTPTGLFSIPYML